MPSSGARVERGAPSGERLLAAARFLAAQRTFGLLWLDRDLRVTEHYGRLVSDVAVGLRVADSVAAFVGYEDELRSLMAGQARQIMLPSVQIRGGDGEELRLNFQVSWLAEEGAYLVLVSRTGQRSEIEQAYHAETRLRRMAEAEVAAQAEVIKQTNIELAIANHDLEEFAYVISHDLRAPLRGLRYAVTDAKAAISAGELEEVSGHLDKVHERSRRMSAMLTGLLDYSRVGRKNDAAAEIETRALAEEIAESSGLGTGFAIEVTGEWPRLVTLAEPLDIALRNLVDNAVKHHDRDSGRIGLACDNNGTDPVFTVSDDGPGIDPAWQVAIFEPFKQVTDEVGEANDGAGIGLALVKKTVERMGGSIEVHSDPAARRGTTFRVVWPRAIVARGR